MGVDTRISKTIEHNGTEITLQYFGQEGRINRGWSYRLSVNGRTKYCAWCHLRFFGESEEDAITSAQWLADRMIEDPDYRPPADRLKLLGSTDLPA